MHIHRTAQDRNFTVLPNGLLRDRSLSYTARGLLADLLSRPDGRREDARAMADTSTQGRGAVNRAIKELTRAGYYLVKKLRMPDGTIRSEIHVYDTPQHLRPPDATDPGSGGATAGPRGSHPKNRGEETPLPGPPATPPPPPPPPPDPPASGPEPDEQTKAAVAALRRVIRPEPRLRLGESEALALAPLVAQWLERGATTADLAGALLPGLPVPLHSPAALLRNRLQRKLPPPPEERPAAVPRYTECPGCHDPVPRPGTCRPCAGLPTVPRPRIPAPDTATTGAARVRTALHAARILGPLRSILTPCP
ncbi:hypothetical protein [Kitasatospora sp. NPDC059571]|uniref:hypothetical protein n=1 Tax=Kitasatospora sp. NPDC059571 TaxID=3346871 RepID=UPI003697BDBF